MTTDFDVIFRKLSVSDERLRILNLLELMGFNSVHVNYSGGGDSGTVEGFDFFPEPVTEEQKKAARFIETHFEETLEQPIWDRHGSFADGGGYSVSGTVIWDSKDKVVDIRGTDYYWEYDEEGEENESSEEDWSEGVCEYEPENMNEFDDCDYSCLAAYAQYVLKDKFPGEYHNRMIASAIEGDAGAKNYVVWLEEERT